MNTTTPSTGCNRAWNPTAAEVAAIVLEMRPIIDRMVERNERLLQNAA